MTAPTDDRHSGPAEAAADGYPPPPQENRGRGFTISAFVLAAIALAFLPFVLGPIGAVLGFVGYSKGDPKGRVAGFTAILCTVIGTVLAILVFTSMQA